MLTKFLTRNISEVNKRGTIPQQLQMYRASNRVFKNNLNLLNLADGKKELSGINPRYLTEDIIDDIQTIVGVRREIAR